MDIEVENVRDYGAVGDGLRDDTSAIQAAVSASLAKTKAVNIKSFQASAPTIFFPAGKYLISQPIKFGSYSTIRGEDSLIVQKKSSDSFVFNDCYRICIEKMQFVGGNNQLSFSNANTDMTRLTVRDCCFQNWSSVAISADGTGPDKHMSATLSISHCVFDGGCILRTQCDSTSLDHCRHQFRGGSTSIINRWSGGVLSLNDFTATPAMPGESRGIWIDNWGSVIASGCRFGGEGGGFPVLNHNGGPNLANPWMGQSVIFRDSQVCCGRDSWPDSALITLNGLPQCISITGCRGITSNSIPLIKLGQNYDLMADITSIRASAKASLGMYSVTIKGNQFYAPASMPPALQQFVR